MAIKIGVERLRDDPSIARSWGRCGLVCNQASVDAKFRPSWELVRSTIGDKLVCLFGPQHGLESAVQDNMIETPHAIHGPTGLKVYSLYSETREPTPEMLQEVDTLLVDLPITGTRIYTYKYTMAACLRAAKKLGKKVVVFDRPNPLGGEWVEGPVLQAETKSFVGEFEIPVRHGMTFGEAALLFNKEIQADLEVVQLEGWDPKHYWHQLGRPWVLTSPNLPTVESCYVFPGGVLLEGTNLSEGRGTTLPFQFVGAPYIQDSRHFVETVIKVLGGPPPGVHLRPAGFQPCFQKWANEECRGLQIHVTAAHDVRSFVLGVAMIRAGIELGDGAWSWKKPPYEYEQKRPPMDLILGLPGSEELFAADSFTISDSWLSKGHAEYINRVNEFLLYRRELKSAQ